MNSRYTDYTLKCVKRVKCVAITRIHGLHGTFSIILYLFMFILKKKKLL